VKKNMQGIFGQMFFCCCCHRAVPMTPCWGPRLQPDLAFCFMP
jgi:hypothetical protein